ncbi:bifunctional diguanylate cyclase/phosphodiesterase [Vacuolonema iberomarrocanum]|uniref:bifunctional diguanylate cyclase/phosphodiesterase n=1 Tax=Vacuolonema iberomarrocanum TaxID=3454632 RepID=UPI001A019BC5|nr:EAL domain-containing protein [filamentous cyanobacterium LEGE 07170]
MYSQRPTTETRQTSRSHRRKAPLQLVLILPVALQIVIAVGVTGWLAYLNGKQAVRSLSNQLRQEVALRVIEYLDDELETSVQLNHDNLEFLQYQANLDDLEGLGQQFWRQLQRYETMGVIYFGHTDGRFIAAQRLQDDETFLLIKRELFSAPAEVFYVTEEGEFGEKQGNIDDFVDIRQRPWYVSALEADGMTWGDIFPLQMAPRIDLPVSTPLYNSADELQGVVGNNLTLVAISQFLQELDIGENGGIYVLERDGQLVASSTLLRPFLLNPDGTTERIFATERQASRMQESSNFLLGEFGSFETIQEPHQFNLLIDGEPHFLEVIPYRYSQGLDWLIVIVVPEANYMAQIWANGRNTFLLSLGALALASVSGVATTRWLMRSLLQLNQAAKGIAQGNLQQTVMAGPIREVGELTDSFNLMAHQLQESFAQLQSLNDALSDSESRLTQFLEALPVGVMVHDAQGNLAYINQVGKDLLGIHYLPFLATEAFPEVFQIYRAGTPELYPIGELPSALALQGQTVHRDDLEVLGDDGLIPLEVWASPILDQTGAVIYAIAAFLNVSDRKHAEQQLIHNAFHDALTDLPNRTYLMQRLEMAIQRAREHKESQFAVLFLDLDRFKIINDSLGHLVGDELLITVAHQLKQLVRSSDLAARLGGDEFVLLLEDIQDVSLVEEIAESVLMEMRLPRHLEGRDVVLSTSIGIVIGTGDYEKASDLLRDADIAMYCAKNRGKAQYVIFDSEMHIQALKQLQLENDFRHALRYTEFVVYYQPIVNLKTGGLVGFEALVRWQHPTQGLLPPGSFINFAEETGLIVPLDSWVMYDACRQLREWRSHFPQQEHLRISINLSARDLGHPQLLEDMQDVLTEMQLPPHCLALELTESLLIENIDSTLRFLAQAKAAGIHISIDDFGTGYSSLSYLHQLPVDALKIDRSFVIPMQAERNQEIASTIITLSRQLGLRTIAEGVETNLQRQWLLNLGCTFGQGHFFGEALPASEIPALLCRETLMDEDFEMS